MLAHAVPAVLDEVMASLVSLGITVTQFHSEAAGGQFEIVTSHKPPFEVTPFKAVWLN